MAKSKQTSASGQLRIIAGKWRGRKLTILDVEGLRPTPDRVRETVFNWLQAYIGGAVCLDLFSGSGALGFEAASRGADAVTLVEVNAKAAQQLQQNNNDLTAKNCQIEHKTAQQFLVENVQQYDIVFIDPPYQADVWTEIAEQLQDTNALADEALIYLECPSQKNLPRLPECWQLLKEKKAGDVRYCLFGNTSK